MAPIILKMTGSLAGENFSYSPGDIIREHDGNPITPNLAAAWKDADLAIEAPDNEVAAERIADLETRLQQAERERDGLQVLKTNYEGKLAANAIRMEALKAELAVHKNAASESAARATRLEKELAAATQSAALTLPLA